MDETSVTSAIPRPLKNRVIIKQDEKQDRVGRERLIYAPQGSEDWPDEGTVVAVGDGLLGPDGERIPLSVKVGDRVLFKRKPESALNHDRRPVPGWDGLVVLPEDNILAVIEST